MSDGVLNWEDIFGKEQVYKSRDWGRNKNLIILNITFSIPVRHPNGNKLKLTFVNISLNLKKIKMTGQKC